MCLLAFIAYIKHTALTPILTGTKLVIWVFWPIHITMDLAHTDPSQTPY